MTTEIKGKLSNHLTQTSYFLSTFTFHKIRIMDKMTHNSTNTITQ